MSTMKTLDQIEARTPIDAGHTPGDGTNQFIISAPGSYYLTGNITGVSGKNGISINADNVTLDLNGFALIGVGGSAQGITMPASHTNLRVYNGSAQSWGNDGIGCVNATNSLFDHLRASQNSSRGIATGNSCTLIACNAASNGGDGIFTGSSCTVTASTSVSNTGNGFNIQNYCTIIGCTASSNTGNGIFPSNDCTIRDCMAAANNGDGIAVFDHCLVTGNNASQNKGNGISSDGGSGQLNRIDGNTAVGNTKAGILWGNDFVARNTSFGNSPDYSPAVGVNNTGPVQTASSATNPWANF